jgi:2-polyprenyl-3-methyl-5-hydroxy-6-metoxy-1,4-benzoquinol methylase
LRSNKAHWETIYEKKIQAEMSWTQSVSSPSIDWIREIAPEAQSAIMDAGGGSSILIDELLASGYQNLAVLDISAAALKRAQVRLGKNAVAVDWIESDIREYASSRKFRVWHDRAVFHFLTDRKSREEYLGVLINSLEPEGFLLIATFSPLGPGKCSGLDVMRFDAGSLAAEVGDRFKLLKAERIVHTTPWDSTQEFQYCLFKLHN